MFFELNEFFTFMFFSNNEFYSTFFISRLNFEAAKLAKRAAIEVTQSSGSQKYVAGAMGPTNRTLSISPSVEKPEYRNISKYLGTY